MSDAVTSRQRTVRLSGSAFRYLVDTAFLPEDLGRILRTAEATDDQQRLLRLDRGAAERFRDALTTRLARIGFGPDYEPTREGMLLEDLIDRFAD